MKVEVLAVAGLCQKSKRHSDPDEVGGKICRCCPTVHFHAGVRSFLLTHSGLFNRSTKTSAKKQGG